MRGGSRFNGATLQKLKLTTKVLISYTSRSDKLARGRKGDGQMMTKTEQRRDSFQKSPDSQWKASWQRIGLQRVSSTCTSWPLIPERRWLVSFTFTANTASRHDTPSLSLRPPLRWNRQLLLQAQTADGTQECSAPLQHIQEWGVFCGLKKTDKHRFHGSTVPFYAQTILCIPALCYRLWSE